MFVLFNCYCFLILVPLRCQRANCAELRDLEAAMRRSWECHRCFDTLQNLSSLPDLVACSPKQWRTSRSCSISICFHWTSAFSGCLTKLNFLVDWVTSHTSSSGFKKTHWERQLGSCNYWYPLDIRQTIGQSLTWHWCFHQRCNMDDS